MNPRTMTSAILATLLTSLAVPAQQFLLDRNATLPVRAANDSAAYGDIDGDGDLDLVLAAAGRNGNCILINDGRGRFTDETDSRAQYPPTADTKATDLADFDGDGDLDLLNIDRIDRRHQLLLNDGTGHFTDVSATHLSQLVVAHSFVRADFDGDGDQDLVVATGFYQVQLLLNNGQGVFSATPAVPAPGLIKQGLLTTDIDADGDMDLIGIATGIASFVLCNNGTGTFTAGSFPFVGNGQAGFVIPADYNGDGMVDIFLSYEGKLFLNLGGGAFREVGSTHLPPYNTGGGVPVAADFDRDGDVDIVGHNYLLVGDGSGRFTNPPGRISLPEYHLGLFAADFDGDLDPDLIFMERPFTKPVLARNLHQHLHAPAAPLIGTPYALEFYCRPGYAVGATFFFPLLADRLNATPLPGLGLLNLDPGRMVTLPVITASTPAGTAKAWYRIPNQPALQGVDLNLQCLVVNLASPLGLTNCMIDRIQ